MTRFARLLIIVLFMPTWFGPTSAAADDLAIEGADAVARWVATVASGQADEVAALLAPEFQLQRADGRGFDAASYLVALPSFQSAPVVRDLVTTGHTDVLVARYMLEASISVDGQALAAVAPRLTVFRRIDGDWRVVAHANMAALAPPE